jgi:hypothetical protein
MPNQNGNDQVEPIVVNSPIVEFYESEAGFGSKILFRDYLFRSSNKWSGSYFAGELPPGVCIA